MPRKIQLTQEQITQMRQAKPELAAFTDEQLALVAEATGLVMPTGGGGGAIGFTLSPKGALSLTGISAQYPVTFYQSQWDRILSPEVAEAYQMAVQKFGKDGQDCLSDKTDSPDVAVRKENVRRQLVPEKFAKADAIAASGVGKEVKDASKKARTIAQNIARAEGEQVRPNGNGNVAQN